MVQAQRLAAWLAIATVAGALHGLTFSLPYGGLLALATLALVAAAVRRAATIRHALAAGWLFGFASFTTGIWWLYVSMHDYGGMPAPLAGAALLLFCGFLGLFPALACAVAHRIAAQASPLRFPAAFACAWLLLEWLRGTVLTGFPWLADGYAFVDGPLSGYAPWLGVYGVGAAATLLAAAVAAAFATHGRARATALAVIVAVPVIGFALRPIRFVTPLAEPLSVRLLQGNVPQQMKFRRDVVGATLDRYRALLTAAPADLVVTPETALPVPAAMLPAALVAELRQFVGQTPTTVLFGTIGVTAAGDDVQFANSAYALQPNAPVYRYDKHHLVPFGEFVPLGFRWFVDLMQIPLGDFSRGAAAQPPLRVGHTAVAVNICYEDLFGEEIAASLRQQPANLLVNITNLGWFGNTSVLPQDLQIARMRSLETQRPVLRAANTGITTAIGADGRVIAALPAFTEGTLTVQVNGTDGLTPYVRTGNAPVVLLALGICGYFWGRKREATEHASQT